MKLRSLIFSSFVAVALSAGMVACSDDDEKEAEIIPDEMETVVEYYVHGSVSSASGALAGAAVKLDAQSATTDNAGNFKFTVKEKKTYALTIEAKDYEKMATEVVVAANAENRSDVKINVQLAKAVVYDESKKETVKKDEPTSVETAPVEEAKPEEKVETTVEVPANAVEENTTISAATYEEPKAEQKPQKEEAAKPAEKKEEASVANVAIKTEPADAKAKSDIAVAVANEGSADCLFDPEKMTFLKTATKAGEESEMRYDAEKNCYFGTIKAGSQIAGKYSVRINHDVKSNGVKKGGNVSVNGVNGTWKKENYDYAAIPNVKLTVVYEMGWDYEVEPGAAMKAAGANEEMAKMVRKIINAAEGAKGYHQVSRDMNASINGYERMKYTAWQNVQTVSYVFTVKINGQKKNVTINVLRKTGMEDSYVKEQLDKHSGGTGK